MSNSQSSPVSDNNTEKGQPATNLNIPAGTDAKKGHGTPVPDAKELQEQGLITEDTKKGSK